MESIFPMCAIHDGVACRSHMEVEISEGNVNLTPLSVRYHFGVLLNINGVNPSPVLTDCLLRSIIQSRFARENKMTCWEQTHQGFTLEFRPELMDTEGTHNRRYFRGLNLYCELVHPITDDINRLFSSIMCLLDLAISTAVNSLRHMVPALFTNFNALQRVQPLVSALNRAIKVQQLEVWQQTEGQLLGSMRPRSREWNIHDPRIIPPVPLEYQDFKVLDDNSTTHTLITVEELRQELELEDVIVKIEDSDEYEECEHEIECNETKLLQNFEWDAPR